MSFANKVVVVTGSSTGIGREIARTLARNGADVILHGKTASTNLQQTETAIRNAGGSCRAVPFDLHSTADFEKFVESCWNWKGTINCWINNAGADILTDESHTLTFIEKLTALFAVDVLATTLLSRLAGDRMRSDAKKNKDSDYSIINIGWDQAQTGMVGDSGQLFGIAKGAVMAFTRSLAQELAPSVRVNCVAPGWIRTDWSEIADTYWQDRAVRESLMGRWGTAEDVANVVAILADSKASFVSGQIWEVNGGFRFSQPRQSQSLNKTE